MLQLELEPLLALRYQKSNGPGVALDESGIDGINCQALVHACYDVLGYPLAETELSEEIFTNAFGHFTTVDEGSLQEGDILFFGKNEENVDLKTLHVGIFWGYGPDGEMYVLHMNYIDKGARIWRLQDFCQYPRYAKYYGARRHHAFRAGRVGEDGVV